MAASASGVPMTRRDNTEAYIGAQGVVQYYVTPADVCALQKQGYIAQMMLTFTFRNGLDISNPPPALAVQLDLVDVSGRTALHVATQEGRVNALREILGRSVDIDARDENGEAALHRAARSGQVRCIAVDGARMIVYCRPRSSSSGQIKLRL